MEYSPTAGLGYLTFFTFMNYEYDTHAADWEPPDYDTDD